MANVVCVNNEPDDEIMYFETDNIVGSSMWLRTEKENSKVQQVILPEVTVTVITPQQTKETPRHPQMLSLLPPSLMPPHPPPQSPATSNDLKVDNEFEVSGEFSASINETGRGGKKGRGVYNGYEYHPNSPRGT